MEIGAWIGRAWRASLVGSMLLLAMLLAGGCSGPGQMQADKPASPPGIQRVALAPNLYEVVHSERQRAVFVAAPGNEGGPHAVLRLDPDTLAEQAHIPVPHTGYGLALDDAADRLYVGHGRAGFVSVIDTASNRVLATLPLGHASGTGVFPYHVRAMRLDPERQRLYVPGLSDKDSVLFVVDTHRQEVIKTVTGLGFYAIGVTVDQARGRVLVGTAYQGIKVVDADRLEVVDTWPVDAGTIYNLTYDPAGDRVLGTDAGLPAAEDIASFKKSYPHVPLRGSTARVFVLDGASGRELASLPTPGDIEPSLALEMDAGRKRLYVTNRGGWKPDQGQGALAVFDSQTFTLLKTVQLPPHPNSLALDRAGNAVFVTVKNDGTGRKAGDDESLVRVGF